MKLPKNIRQMGELEESKKIYIEDYVMTYTKQLAHRNEGSYQTAVLLGQAFWQDNCKHVFINGAVEIKNFDMEKDVVLSNETWSDIYDKIKRYFDEVEIVGWLFSKPGQEFKIDDRLRKTHLENFSGQDKVFMIYDSAEKEESFFLYSGNHFRHLKGYYIYYEKNESMQNFMVERKKELGIETGLEERAVKDMRSIMTNKKEEQYSRRITHYMYGVGTIVAAIVLIVGTSIMSNQSKMKDMEDALNVISDNLTEQDSSTKGSEKEKEDPKLIVETLKGNLNTKEPKSNDPSESQGETQAKSQSEEPSKEEDLPTPDAGNAEINKGEQKPEQQTSATEPPVRKKNKKNKKTEKKETKAEPYSFYIVKKGDTLSNISEKFFQSIRYVGQIKKLNGLSSKDHIVEGQKLLIPNLK